MVSDSRPRAAAVAGRSGGTDGNERLTASTGAVLIVLFAMEGLTVLSLSTLLSWHVFIGVALIPPVLLKLASTGYRFVRYYGGRDFYNAFFVDSIQQFAAGLSWDGERPLKFASRDLLRLRSVSKSRC